jgi:flavorubredoxin
MKTVEFIFEDGNHKWAAVTRDPLRPDYLIDTNEYLVMSNGESLLTDPGGSEIFSDVFAAISRHCNLAELRWLFASHQDPDIISSLALWLEFNPALRCYSSWLWTSFIPHFGGNGETFVSIPDEGMSMPLGKIVLEAVPAHYLHSSGNFHVYDEKARILFSGDVGAALLLPDTSGLFVKDFDKHIESAKVFHQRWMGSKEAVLDWCERAGRMNIDMLCPQHGAIYQGADVERFINWFAELEVGTGVRSKA